MTASHLPCFNRQLFAQGGLIFLGDKPLTQTWSHTTEHRFGKLAANNMRYGGSLEISLCVNFEESDYQPKQRGLNLTNRKI